MYYSISSVNVQSPKKVSALTQTKTDGKERRILNANPNEVSHRWFVFISLYQLASHADDFLRECSSP